MRATMGLKKLLSLGVLGAAMTISSQVSAGTIKNSAHDFSSASGGNWDTQICLACHTPHNGATGNLQIAPLWGHDTTKTTFTLYKGVAGSGATATTSSFDAAASITQPSGTSLLCLSCHDGVVAVDSFGGKSGIGTIKIGTLSLTADLGTDLSNDHPISFPYNANSVIADSSLFDPTITQVTTLAPATGRAPLTGTIDAVLLENGNMECSSCHDVHNTFTGPTPAAGTASTYMLKISNVKSALCLTCHNK